MTEIAGVRDGEVLTSGNIDVASLDPFGLAPFDPISKFHYYPVQLMLSVSFLLSKVASLMFSK